MFGYIMLTFELDRVFPGGSGYSQEDVGKDIATLPGFRLTNNTSHDYHAMVKGDKVVARMPLDVDVFTSTYREGRSPDLLSHTVLEMVKPDVVVHLWVS